MRALALIGNKRLRKLFSIRENSPSLQVPNNPFAWFHCASLGEFEQATPVIKEYIALHPSAPILLSFFSPSGYEPIVANQPKWLRPMDKVCALPFDTPFRVRSFLKSFDYKVKFFAACKYDVWPNLISELSNAKIPTYVFAVHITENSKVLKSSFMRWNWAKLTRVFTQSHESTKLLISKGINAETIGDPRVDRVIELAESSFPPEGLIEWKGDANLVVAGSTWVQEEVGLITLPWSEKYKLIVAPHDVSKQNIIRVLNLFNATGHTASLLSDSKFDTPVIIVDTMGQLTSIYPIADLAIVGGGFGKGIHNILEPAANGIAVITGPNISRFREASVLLDSGVLSIADEQNTLPRLVWDKITQVKPKSNWLNSQKGSSIKIASILP
ncbi:MAG: hypothetical protein CL850_02360 [Crocinitomicaceae bacterium]|nr:hypothetical protein [Crocinitomicaceae bacterium]